MTPKSIKEINSGLKKTPIAIIGIASIFPQSENKEKFWNNIINEVDTITDVPESRWKIDDFYHPDKKVPDKSYSKRGGFIPDIEFNPLDFGLPPNILELTDVSQLLALLVARDVLEDAGYGEKSDFDRDKIGITLGVGGGQKLLTPLTSRLQYPVWKRVLTNCGISDDDSEKIVEKMKKAYIPWEENSFPGMLGNVIAGRVANRLNFGGTNCVLDAACASSLTAIKMGVSELLENRSDIIISGGVDTDNSPFMYLCFSKTPAFTDAETSSPFDENSSGIIIGEGVGMIAMKRLSDAERDNDKIYAVIKGIGTSSDGKFKSIYAPRPEGQAKALRRAYKDAGYEAKSVELIEAHGTGTLAGDIAEFTALNDVFSDDNDRKQHIALGSVKSQIGHCKSAAGSAGIIKVAMALQHKVLPPTINVNNPSGKMDIENTPFYINRSTRPWFKPENEIPRRASVSSFGFGGTNFHFTLEEYTGQKDEGFRLTKVAETSVISAQSPEKLLERLKELKSSMDESRYREFTEEFKIRGIKEDHARIGFLHNSIENAKDLLDLSIETLEKKIGDDSFNHSKGIYYRKNGLETKGKVVAMFSGQGSQYLEMGKELMCNFPPVMSSFDSMNRIFLDDKWNKLTDVVFPIPKFTPEDKKEDEAKLQRTEFAQPAIGSLSAGMFKLLKNAGFEPDYSVGHSFGELTALWAAGVYSEEDFLRLARARGKAMAAPDDPDFEAGTMMAVMGKVENVSDYLKDFKNVTIANYNSTNQVVVAGPKDDIKKLQPVLKEAKFTAIPLPVSAAFHTKLVGHAQKPFAEFVKKVKFNKPKIKVSSNSSGKLYPKETDKIKNILSDHILNSVHFRDQIENIYNEGGNIFVEFGPKNVLTKLVENILKGKSFTAIALNGNQKIDNDTQLRQAVTQLCVAGLNLEGFDPYGAPKKAPREKGKMTVTINGGSYVSEKTQQVFVDALNDGFTVSQATPEIKEVVKEVVKEVKVEVPVYKPAPQQNMKAETKEVCTDDSVKYFYQHQNETVKAHEQYLNNSATYLKTFNEIMGKQFELVKENPDSSINEQINENLAKFHEHQNETLKVHNLYLKGQIESSRMIIDSVGEEVSKISEKTITPEQNFVPQTEEIAENQVFVPSVEETKSTIEIEKSQIFVPGKIPEETMEKEISVKQTFVPKAAPVKAETNVENKVSLNLKDVENSLLEVVSDKTGYPKEMLELDMDMEGDLGIDSIKRVEILSAIMEKHPELPNPDADTMSALKTLNEVVGILKKGLNEKAPVIKEESKIVSNVNPSGDLEKVMLSVVSEKTGYPEEMLELDMDMEGDLGIDSIKRVEIMSAVMENMPDLPHVNPDDLAQLKTLGQIVEIFKKNMDTKPRATEVQKGTVTSGINNDAFSKAMLSVVSEKTGYPEEMLELDMDMEGDLGIDSIKRVEIMSSVMDKFPELPQVNPDDLAQLKTLGQIVEAYTNKMPEVNEQVLVKQPKASATSAESSSENSLKKNMLKVVSEKTGYPEEMLELDMDMEGDLGIDSIKRVEIMSSVMDMMPDLPQINPDELAALKTLGQIVDAFSKSITKTEPSKSKPAETIEVKNADSNISIDSIKSVMMKVVSEKTGYPVEMLELDMDMEGDLGIDSIKRVEIMSAVMDEMPELPQVNPDDLAALKTLGQIVEAYGGSYEPEKVDNKETVKEIAPNVSNDEIQKSMLKIVSEKTGYPEEMLELDMDMEGDLGIDSIKRVEIMSAVMDEHPDLPQVNPDELAALKTLGEIVSALLKAGGGAAPVKTEKKKVEITENKTSVMKAETKIIPFPDYLEFKIPQDRTTLLFDDGTKVTPKLASKLSNEGLNPVVLSFPLKKNAKKEKLPNNVKRYLLKDLTEENLKKTLRSIVREAGAPAGVIYIDPQSKGKNSSVDFSDETLNRLKTLFLTAKYLKKELCDNLTTRNFFITVTRMDGAFGLDKGASDIISGGFAGLVKTLKLEWMNTFSRAVDIDPKTGIDKTVDIIVKEIHDPDRRIAESGYMKKNRVTLVAGTIEEEIKSSGKIDSSSVFLVSGGAKGVTASCAINLAEKTKASFILLGRSSYDGAEPEYLKGINDQAAMKKTIMEEILKSGEKPTPKKVNEILNPVLANREIKSTVDQIEKSGGKAFYLSCDVKDSKSMKKLLKDIVKESGEINGIIHGAGVLADRFIEDKTGEDFDRVLSTKVKGLEAIFEAVDIKNIKHVALFSSAAGFYGNEGQADYSIANEILNKAAFNLKEINPEIKVCSFNWGPWDGGMVTPELKKMFEKKNVTVIPIDEGCDIFSDHMLSDEAVVQVLVGSSMLYEVKGLTSAGSYIIKRELNEEDNGFLEDHVIGGNKVLPTVCATSWMAESCEKVYPGYRFFRCDDYRLYKGIVFDGNHSNDYTVEIEEQGKVNGTVDLNVLISSNGSGKKINHYGAKITLTGQNIEVPYYEGFNKDTSEKEQGETFYNDGTLFHGPDFQAAGELLNISKDKLTMLCRSPKICEERMGQFPVGTFNPYAADVQFQSMLIWVRRFFDAGSLPSAAKSGIQYKSIPEDKEFFVSMDIVKSSDSSMVADIISHDEDGLIYSMVEGAEVTVSKKLKGLFKKADK